MASEIPWGVFDYTSTFDLISPKINMCHFPPNIGQFLNKMGHAIPNSCLIKQELEFGTSIAQLVESLITKKHKIAKIRFTYF